MFKDSWKIHYVKVLFGKHSLKVLFEVRLVKVLLGNYLCENSHLKVAL